MIDPPSHSPPTAGTPPQHESGASHAQNLPTSSPSPAPRYPSRALRRQYAFALLSPPEQAIADAMVRSSSAPAEVRPPSVLGRRPRCEDEGNSDGGDTEPGGGGEPVLAKDSAATAMRYAAKKKLRSEQREAVEDFLGASSLCCLLLAA